MQEIKVMQEINKPLQEINKPLQFGGIDFLNKIINIL
jgi:hypothetical protein